MKQTTFISSFGKWQGAKTKIIQQEGEKVGRDLIVSIRNGLNGDGLKIPGDIN